MRFRIEREREGNAEGRDKCGEPGNNKGGYGKQGNKRRKPEVSYVRMSDRRQASNR